MDLKLTQLNIQGFKSFGKEQNIRFGDITIFIGANGSGKSNLISFFEMLGYMMNEGMAQYVALHSGASFLTHLGAPNSLHISLDFQSDLGECSYNFRLAPTNANYFIFTGEEVPGPQKKNENYSKYEGWRVNAELSTNGKESGLPHYAEAFTENRMKYVGEVFSFLKKSSLFKFYDTSSTSPIRREGYVNNTGYLMSNGGNLAAFLYWLKQEKFKKYYDRIVRNIKIAYPSFEDFVLDPNPFYPDNILLEWKDKSSPPNFRFSPQQLSDGTLRFMALSALLLQPPETIPKVILIDEPELGLHPTAISILSNMIYNASAHSQIVLATQSAQLLDYFEPEHIRVVEREGSNSIVTEHSKEELESWLKNYNLGQIWEKNIIGGRP